MILADYQLTSELYEIKVYCKLSSRVVPVNLKNNEGKISKLNECKSCLNRHFQSLLCAITPLDQIRKLNECKFPLNRQF